MTKHEKIPYPTDEEINQQIQQIVSKGLVKRKSLYSELVMLQRKLGWQVLLPNKNEIVFTVMMVAAILLFEWLTFGSPGEVNPNDLVLFFMFSPIIFAGLSIYSFYVKQENHTFELEMTTKYTVFQLIGVRMLYYSGLSILANASLSLLFMYTLNVGFLRLWLLSLTSLFVFAVGMLYVLKSGRAVRRMLIYSGGWVLTNLLCLNFAESPFIQLLLHLPLIIYAILLIVLFVLFCSAFKAMYLRKQEGIFVC